MIFLEFLKETFYKGGKDPNIPFKICRQSRPSTQISPMRTVATASETGCASIYNIFGKSWGASNQCDGAGDLLFHPGRDKTAGTGVVYTV